MTSKQRRQEIKRLLSLLDEGHTRVFKLLYTTNQSKDVNLVVDEMPVHKLQWALQQCERSYHKIFEVLKREY